MILLLHNRYRHPGGEERAVQDLQALITDELGEQVEVLERDSAVLGAGRAAVGLLRGGLAPDDVAAAVRRTGARVVHAHNLLPSFGPRALQAARGAGAAVVQHLHNYRLVCAVGTCFTHGEDCTRCHGVDTTPGVRLACRGGSPVESLTYAAGISLSQRRIAAQVDRFLVPSAFALRRLHELGAPLGGRAEVLPSAQRSFADRSAAADGHFALVAARLTPEKGVADAIEACARVGRPLVVAGDGPAADELRALAHSTGGDVRFEGLVTPERLGFLRAQAALAIVPSRYAEILPLAALEAMAAGLPTVAARSGGLVEAVPDEGLYPAGDVAGLAARIEGLWGSNDAGGAALARARALSAPAVVAARLGSVYDAAVERRALDRRAVA